MTVKEKQFYFHCNNRSPSATRRPNTASRLTFLYSCPKNPTAFFNDFKTSRVISRELSSLEWDKEKLLHQIKIITKTRQNIILWKFIAHKSWMSRQQHAIIVIQKWNKPKPFCSINHSPSEMWFLSRDRLPPNTASCTDAKGNQKNYVSDL